MAENVRVVVRCRPMNQREIEKNCRNIIKVHDCSLSVENPSDPNAPPKTFTYDNVYEPLAPTEVIYNDICYSLVDNVLEGYNGTIFAYGQTGCGKTHTMQGPDGNLTNSSTPSAQRGIISRSFDHIFEAISVASGVRYLALVSYLEIYNENIRDLLNPSAEGASANHTLKELPGVGVVVPTLSVHTVQNADECYRLLSLGNENRMVGATLMNATSSRSHSIFTISLEQIHEASSADGVDLVTIANSGIRRGKLNLVDLAGSERQNKTGAMGERLKEATKINLSLSALGNVISALVDGKTKHIPYRDSKLTRLLQDSLGGNTKTLMISCISPADYNYDETISTLRYASRAKNISNKPKINEDPKDAKLREYQEEIIKLRKLLENNNRPLLDHPQPDDKHKWLEEEKRKMQLEMEKQIDRLKEQHQAQSQQSLNTTPHADEPTAPAVADCPPQRSPDQKANAASAIRTAAAETTAAASPSTIQMEARKRIELIKQTLIGGERAHDTQLREKRQRKKLDAQRRLSALALALSRVEQSEDRDLLQGHYTNIQHELNVKNEYIKVYRQKVRALEREVSDLQSEFQLDRADYLESIRRLERSLKFYQQILDKALPILRKDGKYWDPDEILQDSVWNDDLKTWKLPETSMNSFKLPPASTPSNGRFKHFYPSNGTPGTAPSEAAYALVETSAAEASLRSEKLSIGDGNDSSVESKSPSGTSDSKTDILNNYFRSSRQKIAEKSHQRKDFALQQSRHAQLLAAHRSQLPVTATLFSRGKPTDDLLLWPKHHLTNQSNAITSLNSTLKPWVGGLEHAEHTDAGDSSLLSRTWAGHSLRSVDRNPNRDQEDNDEADDDDDVVDNGHNDVNHNKLTLNGHYSPPIPGSFRSPNVNSSK